LGKKQVPAGEDWFADFMKTNVDIVVGKPESSSIARAQGINKKAIDYFQYG
jgi:hypothetical protein